MRSVIRPHAAGMRGAMHAVVNGLKGAIAVAMTASLMLSCSGDGHVDAMSDGTLTVKHNAADFPKGLDHAQYAAYDAGGKKTLALPEYPMSDLHVLEGIPIQSTRMVIEYHTDTHEVLSEDTQTFSAGETAVLMPQYHGPAFDPGRLAVVDRINGNLLVRGNLPLTANNGTNPCFPGQAHCFATAEMDARLKEIEPGFDVKNYEVIDVTLIDNQGTRDELTAEANAVGMGLDGIACGTTWLPFDGCAWEPGKLYKSANAGNTPWALVWWPVYACGSRPCNETDTEIGLRKFRFNETSAYLKTLLTTPSDSGRKRLVYFHCVQGTDRTGALHIDYIIDNNPDMTFQEAIERATIGAQQGSDQQQLFPELKPMCTYVGLAYRYCLEKNPGNPARCEMPGGFGGDATLCR